jgi:hypothetical protein
MVESMTLTFDAGTPPMVNDAPGMKLDPVTVIAVPPIDGPLDGEIEVTETIGVG